MKSILEGKKPAKEPRKYPYLGIFPGGEVVLFTAPATGFSIHDPGLFGTTWAESDTEPLRGRVILSND